MAALPLILAGPIVRRVEARSVSVWVALSDAVPVTLRIWADSQEAATTGGQVRTGRQPLATGQPVTPRRFGQKLHVAIVTVELAQPLPPLLPGSLVSYDLKFGGSAGDTWLREQGLLRDETATSTGRLPGVDAAAPLHRALGYAENRLPAFVTPPAAVDRLRLAHASCRRPNGPGYDALAWLDERIEASFTDLDNRPQQLFLTGDQIYADDVAACMLPMLTGLGADLLGAVEKLQFSATEAMEATQQNLPAMFRQRLLRELAGFSTTDGANHLMSFGEYAAMYLAVWSPRVWRALAESTDVLKTPGATSPVAAHLTQWDACASTENTTFTELRTERFNNERKSVEVFRDAVPRVARALANVATYMICDDHEVTDDWNLNARWRNRVYSKPLGRAIVRNGVMAYGIFQAWGNDPNRFSAPHESATKPNHNLRFLEEMQKAFTGPGPYPVPGEHLVLLDRLVGATGTESEQPVLHYQVPAPGHLVAVLDTRTRRSFKGQGLLPPHLLGSTLTEQVPAALTDGRELLLVVSAAPVLGPHLIDNVAQPLLQNIQDITVGVKQHFGDPIGPCEPEGRPVGVEKYDAEGWAANTVALEALLARLAPHGRAVILSGDVHYGCSLVLDYWRAGTAPAADPAPSRIVQLTSSPSRNVFRKEVQAVLRSSALLQRYQTDPRPERLAWKGPASIVVPAGESIGPGRRALMRRSPALVPARLWPPGTQIPDDRPPDWRWRLSLQRDERPETDRPPALRQPALSEELDPADPVAGYRRVAARHAQAALTHFEHLRQMVFANNIGLVSVTAGSEGALHVRHTLLSKDAPESTSYSENTVHDISLAPTTETRPELVRR
ncbi:hypothetical protein ABZ543_27060 [Streptomyces roseifaciens]